MTIMFLLSMAVYSLLEGTLLQASVALATFLICVAHLLTHFQEITKVPRLLGILSWIQVVHLLTWSPIVNFDYSNQVVWWSVAGAGVPSLALMICLRLGRSRAVSAAISIEGEMSTPLFEHDTVDLGK